MALSDVFLTPLGFAALAAAIPIIILYLIRPDPRTIQFPTFRFLTEDRREDQSNPVFERLKRSVLLLLQLLAILLFATALATPYAPVSESSTVEETVLVVDASASMTVQSGGETRFARAVDEAETAVTGTTSVVVAGANPTVELRGGPPDEARSVLSGLSPTAAAGDLRSAISTASSIAGEESRIVVVSDFADDGAWQDAVRVARARGLSVELRQFAAGGEGNVGVVDRSFSGNEVTVAVKNYGNASVTRTASLGGQEKSLSLGPGDVRSLTFEIPASGGTVRLSPGDDFPTDDVSYVAAPSDAVVDVLVVTNDENRYLTTALSVIDSVELTVTNPPTPVSGDYDVVVYSNVNAERLLSSHLEAGREAVQNGGGVVVQAQDPMPTRYGDLLLVSPNGTATNPTLAQPAETELTRNVDFPPPELYVRGELRDGRPVVRTADGTPLIATAQRGEGRILYYGYIEDSSSFKYNYQYPVFWKRAVYDLAGRPPLSELNVETGTRLSFGNETAITTPDGAVTASSIRLDDAGFYEAGGTRYSASLLSEPESAVVAPDIEAAGNGSVATREEERTVPDPLTEWVALAVVGGLVLEVAYLRRRGDL
ncbi:N-terminal double-transmembrane domain-containing protein [Halogeometricum rufum]|uniref:N-terminal double-transmembrane domain-containing protein n=1 Tax=Halogeometricum rufum TaxID=553469 RepID=A0A1I6GTG3_9EURY|nr:VWA domain-containing protein [Halogeometricum rufum]SFR45524.1 N-terminal double-transmembrane domain-containing protein [Halogeometricum rufum]